MREQVQIIALTEMLQIGVRIECVIAAVAPFFPFERDVAAP